VASETSREAELRSRVRAMYGRCLVTLQLRRLASDDEWRRALLAVANRWPAAPSERAGRLVWLHQNDDHIYIDRDEEVLRETVSKMCADSSKCKTLLPTHWPEALQLSVSHQLSAANHTEVAMSSSQRGKNVSPGFTLLVLAHFGYLWSVLVTLPLEASRMRPSAGQPCRTRFSLAQLTISFGRRKSLAIASTQ